jgi:hypothetical protein
MKLTYTTDDPGICQQTLAIYNQVCTNNYKYIKENRSDDVVKYFQLEKQDKKKGQKTSFLSLINVLILLTTTNRVRPLQW